MARCLRTSTSTCPGRSGSSTGTTSGVAPGAGANGTGAEGAGAEGAGRNLRIDVSDTGLGVDPAILPHIFDRFAKGPGSTGSGLGLAIARDLVLAHGGQIEVDSRPGAGATLTVTLLLAVTVTVAVSNLVLSAALVAMTW